MANGVPRKGDDSLLTLVLSIFDQIPIMYLDKRYNDYHFYKYRSIPKVEPIIIHYGKGKPWATKLLTGPVTTYYINKWINFKKKLSNE
jgi:lipopolysaccharide biosynthesis glycosyltransferase